MGKATGKARIPGFLAGASLVSGRNGEWRTAHRAPTLATRSVTAADYLDQGCVMGCMQNCGLVCGGLAGQAKSLCIKECAQENEHCQESCRRPGSPPPPPPPGPKYSKKSSYSETPCQECRPSEQCSGHYDSESECKKGCSGFSSGSGPCGWHFGGKTCRQTALSGKWQCCDYQEECSSYGPTRSCTDFFGNCTGLFRGNGPQYIRTDAGTYKECVGPNQYPWVKECDDGFIDSGCGFCLW